MDFVRKIYLSVPLRHRQKDEENGGSILEFMEDYRMKNVIHIMYNGSDTVENLSGSTDCSSVCVSVVCGL
jgi:hypothetical protein